jgi:hypothetical protein
MSRLFLFLKNGNILVSAPNKDFLFHKYIGNRLLWHLSRWAGSYRQIEQVVIHGGSLMDFYPYVYSTQPTIQL